MMTVKAKSAAGLSIATIVKNNGNHRDDEEEGESRLEPNVGLEFDSAEDAQEVYNIYATKIGFRIGIGQLYRSQTDRSVVSRRFICSKDGFQTTLKMECPAFIRVQRLDSKKWGLANIMKEHNNELEHPGNSAWSKPIHHRPLTITGLRVTVFTKMSFFTDKEVQSSATALGYLHMWSHLLHLIYKFLFVIP